MKRPPFPTSTQNLDWYYEDLKQRFDVLRREAERRIDVNAQHADERRGFGTVCVLKPSSRLECLLTAWGWQWARVDDYPAGMGATLFVDDPLGASPADTLGRRSAAAVAFASAANDLFKAADGRFASCPLEIVSAEGGTVPGIHPGNEADVLAIDLMIGRAHSHIIDRIVERICDEQQSWGSLPPTADFCRYLAWFKAERLNAARAMFDPSLPLVKIPGIPALRRRLDQRVNAIVAAAKAKRAKS